MGHYCVAKWPMLKMVGQNEGIKTKKTQVDNVNFIFNVHRI